MSDTYQIASGRGSEQEPFPDVNGAWDMAIHWTRDGNVDVLVANAQIRQQGSEISMTVRSEGSDSHTILVQAARNAVGDPVLYYMYEVEPRVGTTDASMPYKGAAVLRYYEDGPELSGNYWTSRRSTGTFRLTRKSPSLPQSLNDATDVLLVTALKEEFEAAELAFSASSENGDGVHHWLDLALPAAPASKRGVFHSGSRPLFTVVLARPQRMGGIVTGQLAAVLAVTLKPGCLVMCGVCAGNPQEVALGDIVVSEIAYQYDEGKQEVDAFFGDHRQRAISQMWQDSADSLSPETLPSFGVPSPRDARFWFLERLYAGDDPRKHPARARYVAEGEWKALVEGLVADNFIERAGTSFRLTHAGRDEVEWSLATEIDPPERLPIAIKVGPMASGNVVVKDGVTWDQLKSMGIRNAVGLEMEAAALALAAHSFEVPQWIVMKGVMDHADPRKDDRFKPFAARASAEALRAFLVERYLDEATSSPIRKSS
jgi:nucleoside phosphorylase